MDRYAHALQKANKRSLPLSSVPRMKAAIEAISNSQEEVVAVSIWTSDYWHLSGSDSPYVRVNVDKSKQIPVRRVVVVENAKMLAKARKMLAKEELSSVKMLFVVRSILEAKLRSISLDGSVRLCNVLICDKKILTRSIDRLTHDGELTLDYSQINEERDHFDLIWGYAEAAQD